MKGIIIILKKNILKNALMLTLSSSMCLTSFSCSNKTSNQEGSSGLDISKPLTLSKTPSASALPDPTVYEISKQSVSDNTFELMNSKLSEKTVTLSANNVSAIQIGKQFGDDATSYLECDVMSNSKGSEYQSLYFAFRLDATDEDATTPSGVWIALKNDMIGMRRGEWPSTQYFKTTVDFSTERKLYFEDDPVANEIRVFANDDNGTKIKLATVKIDGVHILMYREGTENALIKDKFDNNLNRCGFMRVWAHYSDSPCTISNLRISGIPYISSNDDSANILQTKDVFADTWVATDDLGRITLTGVDEKGVSSQKTGIFYFMWHDGEGDLFDHSKTYYEEGLEAFKKVIMSGNLGFSHYWAQPYFGYYRSDDEWVIRKHAYMLNEAGIDFVYFDVTNGLTYPNVYKKILEVWNQMRMEGYDTPDVMFNTGILTEASKASLQEVWNNIYSIGKYKDFWVMWDGKPLIFADKTAYMSMSKEIQDAFTVRTSWANTDDLWYSNSKGIGAWPWADMYPQKPGISETGKEEQMIVMCGFWVNGSYGTNAGRSYSNGVQPKNESPEDFGFSHTFKTSGLGLAYQEQFDRAIEIDPKVVMITGWNEWWAGRWEAGDAIGQTIANTYEVTPNDPLKKNYFVDNFNPEYSRDLEPVTGLFKDNYFYQTVMNVRKLKGARAIPAAFGQKTIDISKNFEQWLPVGPEFRDYQGDTAHRNANSYVGGFTYINESGRNDFVTSKVSADNENVYFYAECAEDITAAEGTNWMNLFIDADCDAKTGWYGYDYVINRSQNKGRASVEKFADGEWKLEAVGEVDFTVTGKYIQIKVPKSVIALKDTFDFKWADNSVTDGDIMQFIDLGDTAPNDRFNYRYTTIAPITQIPSCLTDDMIVLKAGSYNAYVGKSMVMLDIESTRAVALGIDDKVYLPSSFVVNTLKLSVDNLEVVGHYGIPYVMATDVIKASGKKITISKNGLIVIAQNEITDADILTTLYRTLL